jgi:predicted ribosome quality control (RQC) complex YloA/Tae2 family protein
LNHSNASAYGEQSPAEGGGGRSLLRAPSAQDFDALKTELEGFIFKLQSLEIKCE